MKKLWGKIFCVVALLVAAASAALASLPAEVGGWRIVSEDVTELAAPENLGKWVSAVYARAERPARVDVQLTEGTGPGRLFVPDGAIFSGDGPIGSSSSYETLSVAGRRAILEQNALTGQALAVADGTRALTFEARGLSREELIAFAGNMLEALGEAQ